MPVCNRRFRTERVPNEVLSDLPHRARELSAIGQDIVERGDEKIHFFFGDDERRENFDHVHRVAGDLRQNPMLAQHLGDDHLGEEDLVDFVEKLPRHLEFELGRLVKLDSDDEAFPAHFLDEGMFRAQRVYALDQERAHSRGILDQLLVIEHFEGRESASHREIVPAEGCRVNDTTIHPAESPLVDFAASDDRATRHVAATQTLRESNDVGLEIPVLKPEHFSGATEPGLDFVAEQQRSVFPAKLLRPFEEIGRRRFAAFALDRLDDEGCDITFR